MNTRTRQSINTCRRERSHFDAAQTSPGIGDTRQNDVK